MEERKGMGIDIRRKRSHYHYCNYFWNLDGEFGGKLGTGGEGETAAIMTVFRMLMVRTFSRTFSSFVCNCQSFQLSPTNCVCVYTCTSKHKTTFLEDQFVWQAAEDVTIAVGDGKSLWVNLMVNLSLIRLRPHWSCCEHLQYFPHHHHHPELYVKLVLWWNMPFRYGTIYRPSQEREQVWQFVTFNDKDVEGGKMKWINFREIKNTVK